MSADCFPEVRSPCSTGFWFPKSLESLLRLSLVYCNTKEKPLQTSPSPIKIFQGFRKPKARRARRAHLRETVCAHEATEELLEDAMGAGAAGMSGCA